MGEGVAWGPGQTISPAGRGGPSGEGMSSMRHLYPATAGREATGKPTLEPTECPGYGSVMTMYSTYYSIVMVLSSLWPKREAPEVDEEQEDSSVYKCPL